LFLKFGWVPETDFSLDRMTTRFLPPALFFFNLYYYMGLSTALRMIDCTETGEGFDYVTFYPYLKCYEGDHPGYVVLAWVGVFIYLFCVPIWYCTVFFHTIPSMGYDNTVTITRYGFLYRRFEKKYLYWELVEMARKFCFIGVWLLKTDVKIQVFLVLLSVTLILSLEFYYHPFRSKLYDYLEEFTSFTEFMILLLGLMLTAEPDPKDWIEPIAWVFVIISFILIIFSLVVDIYHHVSVYRNQLLRERLNIVLSPAIFRLEFAQNLLVNYLKQASEEQLEHFRMVESGVIRHTIEKRGLLGHREMVMWSSLAATEPGLINWLAKEEFNLPANLPVGEAAKGTRPKNPAKLYINGAIEKQTQELYPYFIFNKMAGGAVLSFLSDIATAAELNAVRSLFTSLTEFYYKQQAKLKTLNGRIGLLLLHSYFDKSTIKDNEEWEIHVKEMEGQTADIKAPRLAAGRARSQSVKSYEIRKSDGAADGPQQIEGLLMQLASEIPCEAVALIPVKGNSILTEPVYAFSIETSSAIVARDIHPLDISMEPGTPQHLCVTDKTIVYVDNALSDQRFAAAVANHSGSKYYSFSQLCVPLSQPGESGVSVVLKLVNRKSSDYLKKGLSFDSRETVRIVELFGAIMLTRLISKDFEGIAGHYTSIKQPNSPPPMRASATKATKAMSASSPSSVTKTTTTTTTQDYSVV